jgi:hypothetical protein
MAEEIDDQSWDLLNASDAPARSQSDTSRALGMIVRMTRLHDLGLGQLCFGPGEVEPPVYCEGSVAFAVATPTGAS